MALTALEKTSDKLKEQAEEARRILMEKGSIKPDPTVEEGRSTIKTTVGAIILGYDQPSTENPDELELALGLHHIKPKGKPVIQSMTLIGGGIPSFEEKSLQAQLSNPAFAALGNPFSQNAILEYFRNADGSMPKALPLGGKLFFMIQAMHLATHGTMIQLRYDMDAGILESLRGGLKVRMGEEIGQEATADIEVVAHLDGPKLMSPVPFGSPDQEQYSNAVIVGRINDPAVKLNPTNGRIDGLWTKINEEGFLVRADIDALSEHAQSTEDVRAIVRIRLGDLIAQTDKAIANGVESWDGWMSGEDGLRPRNDSLLWMAHRAVRKILEGEVRI